MLLSRASLTDPSVWVSVGESWGTDVPNSLSGGLLVWLSLGYVGCGSSCACEHGTWERLELEMLRIISMWEGVETSQVTPPLMRGWCEERRDTGQNLDNVHI